VALLSAGLLAQRGAAAETERDIRQRVGALDRRTTTLAAQLESVNESCEEINVLVQDRLADISGATKLHAIKAALVALRRDNKALVVQLGVMRQRVEQLRYGRARQQSETRKGLHSLTRHAPRAVGAAASMESDSQSAES